MILPRHERVVLWGLRGEIGDSFQHIWRHYAHALFRLDKPYLWLPDEAPSREWVEAGDLLFAVDVAANELGPPIEGVDYLLHNILDTHPVRDGLDPDRCVYLQVWTNDAAERGEAWGPVRRWDRHSRVLYQPWGTDLLADEFMQPVFNPDSVLATFVGSVWDGNGQGNRETIRELAEALERHGLVLHHRAGVDDAENAALIRQARIAPALTGQWQVDHDYLPCRFFKNISYGALGMTNVRKAFDLCGGAWWSGQDLDGYLEAVLSLTEDQYVYYVAEAQEVVAREYTYLTSLIMIERAFEEIR